LYGKCPFFGRQGTGEKGKLFGSFDSVLREAKAARSLRKEHLIISSAIREKGRTQDARKQ